MTDSLGSFGLQVNGWCPSNVNCGESHDIDRILDSCKRKKKDKLALLKSINDGLREQNLFNLKQFTLNECDHHKKRAISLHNSGFDAFMTGYCFTFYLLDYSDPVIQPGDRLSIKTNGLHKMYNKLYLTGKDQPLMIKKSNFGKLSQPHLNKIKGIFTNHQQTESECT